MGKDEVFLKHILDEMEFLRVQSKGLDLEALRKDEVLQRACVRSLEIIGEAVKNLSTELKERYPDVDWNRAAGLRDKLIHHYFGVDWEIVWNVLTEKLPEMERGVRELFELEFPE